MKIVTYNVNSVRSRMDSVLEFLAEQKPDLLGLQEIKVQTDLFPYADLAVDNYISIVHGQKSYHGVAVLARKKPTLVNTKLDFEGDQARAIYTKFKSTKGDLHFVNCYFPQGESRGHPIKFPYKQKFYAGIFEWIKANFDSQTDKLILVGDFNIAPSDYDIGIGEENKKRWLRTGKCSFLPEEHEMLQKLTNWGLFDPYRELYPTSNDFFSWFDYRSKGFEANPKRGLRIDYALCTKSLLDLCQTAHIDYDTRRKARPSDHAPVIYTFDLELA